MWGHLCTELTNLYNFNVSFSTHKSEILLHLSQWQYWWWFWFSFFWTFYFFVILRVIKHRTFKMSLKINTSFRSRGKWGDYLVTLIPLSWCLNILLNSNFILRMIEWQAEAGTLIIRIHGKQWYWVYKYDLSNVQTVAVTPKNVGYNKWVNLSQLGDTLANQHTQNTQIKLAAISKAEYWNDALLKEFNKTSTFTVNTKNIYEPTYIGPEKCPKQKIFFINDELSEDDTVSNNKTKNSFFDEIEKAPIHNLYDSFSATNHEINQDQLNQELPVKTIVKNAPSAKIVFYTSLASEVNKQQPTQAYYENINVDDEWEVYSNIRPVNANAPARIVCNKIFELNQNTTNNIYRWKFNESNTSITAKPDENIDYLVVKQKRYKRKQGFKHLNVTSTNTKIIGQTSRFLKNNLIFKQLGVLNTTNGFNFYISTKLNKNRGEMFSINLSRRLLRTTRTLVLPAYTNLSIIANSYDVVHSWFIPGLGIKMDCVPGKSTHHSLYIDNVGLYYGQCAEICGRYHHHMPIRICAIPFDHFIVWWTSKGLPKILKMRYVAKQIDQGLLLKYIW